MLAENTELSLFWDMFQKGDVIDDSPFYWDALEESAAIAVNSSGLCVIFNTTAQCIHATLSIHYNVRFPVEGHPQNVINHEIPTNSRELWLLCRQKHFKPAFKKNLALCEKPVRHIAVLTKCSDLYKVCDDGTCVHDSLVCDGKPHCQHGEDEADCQHICSDHSHSVCQEVVYLYRNYETKSHIALMDLMNLKHVFI